MQRSLQAGLAGSVLLSSLASGQIAFENASIYAAPQRPSGMCACDLDGDGDADLVVTTEGPDKLSLYYNQGGGSYTGPLDVPLGSGSSPSDVDSADLDGDGDVDLIVCLKGSNSVRVVINSGTSFMLGSSTPTGGQKPIAVAAGDVNADGMIDVVTANRDSNDISVLLNNAGLLASGVTTSVGADPRGLALGDLDADGKLDLAVCAHDDRALSVLYGTGSGAFGLMHSLPIGSSLRPEGVAMGDMDGDGDLDLIATSSGGSQNLVSSFTNIGGALTGPTHSATGGLDPDGLVVADFDNDGLLDVAVANQQSNTVAVLPGIGAASFGVGIVLSAGLEPSALVAADMDGDGAFDLAVVNESSDSLFTYINNTDDVNGSLGATYCLSLPNSSGQPASISATGSEIVANQDFTLHAASLPVGQLGYFLMSSGQGFQPGFGGSQGTLCLGSPISRFSQALLMASPSGRVSLVLDLGNLPDGSSISAGQTWNFQYWTRDQNPGLTSNTSPGLQVSFL